MPEVLKPFGNAVVIATNTAEDKPSWAVEGWNCGTSILILLLIPILISTLILILTPILIPILNTNINTNTNTNVNTNMNTHVNTFFNIIMLPLSCGSRHAEFFVAMPRRGLRAYGRQPIEMRLSDKTSRVCAICSRSTAML